MFMYQGEIPVVIKINIIIKFIKIYGIWMEENSLKKGYGKFFLWLDELVYE